MPVITKAGADEVVDAMNDAGFEVTRLDEHDLTYTCPRRSRLVFGAVMFATLVNRQRQVPTVMTMLAAAHTMKVAIDGTPQMVLYFPGYTVA